MFCQKAKGWRVVLPLFLLSFFLSAGLSGCGPRSVVGPMSNKIEPMVEPPDFLFVEASESLPALIQAERQASIYGDLELLALLWAEDARIIDGRGSAVIDDDYIWSGREALLDRYTVAVFPNPPPPLTEPLDLVFEYDETEGTALNAIDRWIFVKAEGRWWLSELTYSYKAYPQK